jgi:hypothetical protein
MSQCPQIDGKYTPLRENQWTKQYQWIVHTMDNIMILFQCWAGSADDDMTLLLVDDKNYSWQLYGVHDGEMDG